MYDDILTKVRQLQEESKKAYTELENKEFIGKASGVTVTLLGNKKMIDLVISDDALLDKSVLQEAIIIATNIAVEKIDKEFQEIPSKLGFPGNSF